MVATDEQILDVIERSGLLDVLARGSVIRIASPCSTEIRKEVATLQSMSIFDEANKECTSSRLAAP